MEHNNESKAVEVFTGDLVPATMIKTILEDNDIPAFLNNEALSSVAPYIIDGGGMAAVRVIVADTDRKEALKLISEFQKSKPISDN